MALTTTTDGTYATVGVDGSTSFIPSGGFRVPAALGAKLPVQVLSATVGRTFIAAESGTTFMIPQTTASITHTLPSPTGNAGVVYYFRVQAVPDGTHTVSINSPTSVLNGRYIGVAAAPVMTAFSGKANLILGATAANCKVNDGADIYCDGTSWMVNAWSSGTASAWTAP